MSGSKPYRPSMTLMPGESTHITIPMPQEFNEHLGSGGHLRFEQVPPPKEAPIQDIAETLGLCAGLRAERSSHQYRCSECHRMQPNGSWLVWVPDSVRRGDPAWSVTEACRTNAFNGTGSGWCLSCAPKALKVPKITWFDSNAWAPKRQSPTKYWWQFWK
jgi:hypothetical protein